MTTLSPEERIIVGVDGATDGVVAAEYAARLAHRLHAVVVLLHAYRRSPALNPLLPLAADPISSRNATTAVAYHSYAPGFNVDLMREAGSTALDAVGDHLRSMYPQLRIEKRLVAGSAGKALVHESAGARLVVVARNHERSVERFFAGSTSNAVVAHAHCPVIVTPTNWRDLPETGRIVVGLDAGRQEHAVLTFAFEQASLQSAQLVAVHSWDLEDYWDPPFEDTTPAVDVRHGSGRRAMSEALAGWAARFPNVRLTTHFSGRSPARALVEASDGADLVVVGARGQGGFRDLALGSTARSVVNHATCPVAVVRHGERTEQPEATAHAATGMLTY